jgi:hypothetical protein
MSLMMEAVHTSETSVYFNNSAWRYIPQSCHLYTTRSENFKFYEDAVVVYDDHASNNKDAARVMMWLMIRALMVINRSQDIG